MNDKFYVLYVDLIDTTAYGTAVKGRTPADAIHRSNLILERLNLVYLQLSDEEIFEKVCNDDVEFYLFEVNTPWIGYGWKDFEFDEMMEYADKITCASVSKPPFGKIHNRSIYDPVFIGDSAYC